MGVCVWVCVYGGHRAEVDLRYSSQVIPSLVFLRRGLLTGLELTNESMLAMMPRNLLVSAFPGGDYKYMPPYWLASGVLGPQT